ncbi:MAG: hypothetical protein JW932_04285 [Deltaproteobacteria bacterium]|nr:hypothetical protein [Deltaproteobacteria bacterium]
MGKEKNDHDPVLCPVGKLFSELEEAFGKKSKFFEHMSNSRIEFLKAIRTLVDEKIETLEQKSTEKSGKKSTKIKVE